MFHKALLKNIIHEILANLFLDGEGDKGMEFKKSGNQVIQSIINAESERHAGKNLLFSEYSENELSN